MNEAAESVPQLFLDRNMAEPVMLAAAGGFAALVSVRAPDSEGSNQDAALVLSLDGTSAVLAVADGAGGHPSGGKAAELATQLLAAAAVEAHEGGDSLREAILNGFERANRAVLDLRVGAATTLVVAEISGGRLRSYHVGDSTTLVVGQRGKVRLLTASHSPVGYAVQAGVLDPQDALHHEDLSVVSNLVGATDMRIEIGAAVKLMRRDTVVIGSDGLFDNLHVHEIVEMVRIGPLEQAASKLRAACCKRMVDPEEGQPSKPDDLTFIVFRP